MKPRLCSILSLFLFVGFADVLVAKSKLLDRIPSDSVLVVSVDDWSDFSEKIEDGPFGLFSKSPAWRKMSEWMEDEFESGFGEEEAALEEMIEQMKEWKDSFNGGLAMSVGGFDKMLERVETDEGWRHEPLPHVVFLMETEKTGKDLVKTLRWMKKEIKRSNGNFEWDRSTVEGTEVHWIGNNKSKDNEKAAVFIKEKIFHLILHLVQALKIILLHHIEQQLEL